VGLDASTVGLCLLLGQISDAFSTQIIGLYSDKISTRFGKRMPFYYFGFLLVVPSAICLFVYPYFVNESDPITKEPLNPKL
jgi:Na+/melibiose symporter-like transporter